MAEEDSHIQKTRTTALKVIVDEQLVNDVNKTREFMAKVFDMPKLLEKKEVIKRTCGVKNGDRTFETAIDPAFAETMISVGLDITKLPEFKEEPDTKYVHDLYTAGYHIQKLVGINDSTDVNYEFHKLHEQERCQDVLYIVQPEDQWEDQDRNQREA